MFDLFYNSYYERSWCVCCTIWRTKSVFVVCASIWNHFSFVVVFAVQATSNTRVEMNHVVVGAAAAGVLVSARDNCPLLRLRICAKIPPRQKWWKRGGIGGDTRFFLTWAEKIFTLCRGRSSSFRANPERQMEIWNLKLRRGRGASGWRFDPFISRLSLIKLNIKFERMRNEPPARTQTITFN